MKENFEKSPAKKMKFVNERNRKSFITRNNGNNKQRE